MVTYIKCEKKLLKDGIIKQKEEELIDLENPQSIPLENSEDTKGIGK